MGEHECPTCGGSFDTENAMKTHHTMVHDESISGVGVVCDQCGGVARFPPSTAQNRKYCSEECMAEAYESKIQLECEACGECYEVRESREESRFCSRKCATEVLSSERRDRVDAECAQCGGRFGTYPHRVENQERLFCGQDCYGEWISEHKSGEDSPHWCGGKPTGDCANCGASTTQHYGNAKRTSRAFCDWDCYSEWASENMVGEANPRWRGGPAPYGKGWTRAKREAVRERDGRECQSCGMDQTEHKSEFAEKLHVHHITPAREVDDPEVRNSKDNLITLCRSCHQVWEQMAPLRPDTGDATAD